MRKFHTHEVSLLFLTAFGCFSPSAAVGLSGVMALFFCGISLGHYNFYNLSRQTKISSTYMFETFASLAETSVFAYMGVSFTTGRIRPYEPGFIMLVRPRYSPAVQLYSKLPIVTYRIAYAAAPVLTIHPPPAHALAFQIMPATSGASSPASSAARPTPSRAACS